MKLYKYTSCAAAVQILATGQMLLRHPRHFNDPFDGHLHDVTTFDSDRFRTELRRLAQNLIREQTIEFIDPEGSDIGKVINQCRVIGRTDLSAAMHQFDRDTDDFVRRVSEEGQSCFSAPRWLTLMNQMRILCLSEVFDSIAMWSHYADGHRGAVIEVAIPDEFIDRFEKVQYVEKYPEEIQPAVYWARKAFGEASFESKELFTKQLATKHEWWRYEREWRIVIDAGADQSDPRPSNVDITGLYLGCNIAEAQSNSLISHCNILYPQAGIWQGRLDKQNYRLEFDAIIDPATEHI